MINYPVKGGDLTINSKNKQRSFSGNEYRNEWMCSKLINGITANKLVNLINTIKTEIL